MTNVYRTSSIRHPPRRLPCHSMFPNDHQAHARREAGEGVAEAVGVQAGDAGCCSPAFEHLLDALTAQRSLSAQPQVRAAGVLVGFA